MNRDFKALITKEAARTFFKADEDFRWVKIVKRMACSLRPYHYGHIERAFELANEPKKNIETFISDMRRLNFMTGSLEGYMTGSVQLTPKSCLAALALITEDEYRRYFDGDSYSVFFGVKDPLKYLSEELIRFIQYGICNLDKNDPSFANTEWVTSSAAKTIAELTSMEGTEPFLERLPDYVFEAALQEDFYSVRSLQEIKPWKHFEDVYFSLPALKPMCEQYLDGYELYVNFLLAGDCLTSLSKMHEGTLYHSCMQAIMLQYSGEHAKALAVYKGILKDLDSKLMPEPYLHYMYVYALQMDGSPRSLSTLKSLASNRVVRDDMHYIYIPLLNRILGNESTKELMSNLELSGLDRMEQVMFALFCKHYKLKIPDSTMIDMMEIFVSVSDYKLFQLEYSADFARLKPRSEELKKELGISPLLPYYNKKEEWEMTVDLLLSKFKQSEKEDTSVKPTFKPTTRIAYMIDKFMGITPCLQKSSDGGNKWTAGRKLAKSAFKYGEVPGMRELDFKMAKTLSASYVSWGKSNCWEFNANEAYPILVDCPKVFMFENPLLRIDVKKDEPQLVITKGEQGYVVSNNIDVAGMQLSGLTNIVVDTPQSYRVLVLRPIQFDIINEISRIGIFPFEAADKLRSLLKVVSREITVMSDLLKGAENVEEIQGSSLITVQLRPIDEHIEAQLFIRPLPEGKLYCSPAEGAEIIGARVNDRQVQILRDVEKEKQNFEVVLDILQPLEDCVTNGIWMMNIVQTLRMLDLLREHSEACCVEWPEGAKLRLVHPKVQPGACQIRVKGVGHWFEVQGEVKISDEISMSLAEFLNRLNSSEGNFVQLDNDEYLALSETLRRQLAALSRMMQVEKGKLKLSAFNVSMLDQLDDAGFTFKADKAYRDLVKRIEDAGHAKYSIPKNIQADLRDYQKDGYRWMAQLAAWGAGACLADDMGLGKTLQSITLMMARAKQGPSLVIVPTSVLINWQSELQRFAPELRPLILNKENEGRARLIKEADRGDVVFTTYGLLITEEKILCSREWNVIVLDEAHTIKNRETKMSKAAMKLNGDFRLLLTGTPIQNHLGELWSLFQFANPGLLGSAKQFDERFATPIEKDKDKERQRLLKRVLSPFILRRTKSEVLNELPEKTEITLSVEMSEAEWALYESIRQQALLSLEEGEMNAMQALTEITRLRQAACHPALVDMKYKLKSSKSEAFMNLVEELKGNHHRALVFSQFTSHLALIRKELDKACVAYLYLDGATSSSERQRLVGEFQMGDVPLFLISLKAGGLGLNLTAADYVIHLDPWWNPAVEDQASDRAYRIGQKHPVTVYRLITQGTIEEKIINLHQKKKSLADALLEGADVAQKLSRDEMLGLLREGRGTV